MDKQVAEQDVSWLGARLREPSTYAGLAGLLALVHLADIPEWVSVLSYFGMGLGGLIAIFLPEAGAKAVVAWLIFGVASLLVHPAHAADLTPVKAQIAAPAPVCTATSCSGWYGGVDLAGVGSNVDVLGQGIQNSVFAGGGIFGAHGGYQLWNGTYFAAFEAGLGMELPPQGTSVKFSNSQFDGWAFAEVGVGLTNFLGSGPANSSASPIPFTIGGTILSPYALIGPMIRGGNSQIATGAGLKTLLAPNWTADAKYVYLPPSNGNPATNLVWLSINRHF